MMMNSIISSDEYRQIVREIEKWNGSNSQLIQFLCGTYNFSQRTAASIISVNFIRKMKDSHFRTSRYSGTLWSIVQEKLSTNQEAGIIFKMAEHHSSPALMAKVLLDEYVARNVSDLSSSNKSSFSVTNDEQDNVRLDSATKDHDIANRTKIPGEGRNTASRMIRDTTLIDDGRLASEILLCDLYDDQYGPISEMYNRGIGEEFEDILRFKALEAGLSFASEDELRMDGYDKTPDIKLHVPIAVDGFVINWIESKGLFGDTPGHRGYISQQYSSYWNRFGPGLVIYWLGYEDSILDPLERRFIIRASFPDNITHMQPLLLSSASI